MRGHEIHQLRRIAERDSQPHFPSHIVLRRYSPTTFLKCQVFESNFFKYHRAYDLTTNIIDLAPHLCPCIL